MAAIEEKCDHQFKVVFEILKQLMDPAPASAKRPIGFVGAGSGRAAPARRA
jgi:hypothetical protein